MGALVDRLGADRNVMPSFGGSEQSGRPHIEEVDGHLDYVIAERGTEFSRVTTHDLDDLLYRAFKDITFGLAMRWELAHRVEGQDIRILLFTKNEELLASLSPEWAARYREGHAELYREVGLA